MIVLQNLVIFRSNWANLVDENQSLLLITSRRGVSSLGANAPYFDQIIIAEPYSFEEIVAQLSNYLSSQYYPLEDIRILCNDEYLLPLAARLREHFHFIGDKLNDIVKFTDKIKMKETISTEIQLPKYMRYESQMYISEPQNYIDEAISALSLPIIAKPINLAACDGVAKITSKAEFQEWPIKNRHVENYELDEYIEGTLYHIDSAIQDNQILAVFIGQYSSPVADFLTGKSNGTILLSCEDEVYKKLTEYNQKVLDAMGKLPNCMTHLEVFINPKGEVIFLEIAARAAGGMIPQMYQKAFGIHIEETHFKLQMGKEIRLPSKPHSYVAWLWFPQLAGKRLNKSAELLIESAYEAFWDIDEETIQSDINSIRDRIGGIMIENQNLDQLKEDFHWLCHHYYPYR